MKYGEMWKGKPLTKKEIKTLELVASGLGNKEVGESLNTPWQTIRCRMNTIGHKLNTKTRTGTIIVAIQKGIIDVNKITVELKT
jgi:LuxR family maltose regulon positive regulatory protein